jgi:hypothetical protein
MALITDILALKRLREVSGARQAAAQMRMAQAAARVFQLEERRSESARGLQDDQQQWAESLGRRPLDLPLAGAWSHAVLRRADELARIGGQISQAEEEKSRRGRELGAASVQADAISERTAAAEGRLRRKLEEASLAEAADRFARKAISS